MIDSSMPSIISFCFPFIFVFFMCCATQKKLNMCSLTCFRYVRSNSYVFKNKDMCVYLVFLVYVYKKNNPTIKTQALGKKETTYWKCITLDKREGNGIAIHFMFVCVCFGLGYVICLQNKKINKKNKIAKMRIYWLFCCFFLLAQLKSTNDTSKLVKSTESILSLKLKIQCLIIIVASFSLKSFSVGFIKYGNNPSICFKNVAVCLFLCACVLLNLTHI